MVSETAYIACMQNTDKSNKKNLRITDYFVKLCKGNKKNVNLQFF